MYYNLLYITLRKRILFNKQFHKNLNFWAILSMTNIFYCDIIIGIILTNVLKRLLKNAVFEDPGLIYYFVAFG